MHVVRCPNCGVRYQAREMPARQVTITCQKCQRPFAVGGAAEARSEVTPSAKPGPRAGGRQAMMIAGLSVSLLAGLVTIGVLWSTRIDVPAITAASPPDARQKTTPSAGSGAMIPAEMPVTGARTLAYQRECLHAIGKASVGEAPPPGELDARALRQMAGNIRLVKTDGADAELVAFWRGFATFMQETAEQYTEARQAGNELRARELAAASTVGTMQQLTALKQLAERLDQKYTIRLMSE